jgi:predicted nucleic acid-binding protein
MFVAVDTNFLLGLAWEDEDATDALETLRSRAPHLIVSATPTVLEEVRFFQKQTAERDLKLAATKCFALFKTAWQFNPVVLSPAQEAQAQTIGEHIGEAHILPREERHDALILAEAALIEAKLLVTNDSILRGVDYARLVFELGGFGLHPPVIATPREIVTKFFH